MPSKRELKPGGPGQERGYSAHSCIHDHNHHVQHGAYRQQNIKKAKPNNEPVEASKPDEPKEEPIIDITDTEDQKVQVEDSQSVGSLLSKDQTGNYGTGDSNVNSFEEVLETCSILFELSPASLENAKETLTNNRQPKLRMHAKTVHRTQAWKSRSKMTARSRSHRKATADQPPKKVSRRGIFLKYCSLLLFIMSAMIGLALYFRVSAPGKFLEFKNIRTLFSF